MTASYFLLLLFAAVLPFAGSAFLMQLLLRLSTSVHRRAREILYMRDHGIPFQKQKGLMETISHWQANRDQRERERDLPRAGDLISLKPMYSHMFGVIENPTYLVLGYSPNEQSKSQSPYYIDLQRVDADPGCEKVTIKVTEWDRSRYDVSAAAGGPN